MPDQEELSLRPARALTQPDQQAVTLGWRRVYPKPSGLEGCCSGGTGALVLQAAVLSAGPCRGFGDAVRCGSDLRRWARGVRRRLPPEPVKWSGDCDD